MSPSPCVTCRKPTLITYCSPPCLFKYLRLKGCTMVGPLDWDIMQRANIRAGLTKNAADLDPIYANGMDLPA